MKRAKPSKEQRAAARLAARLARRLEPIVNEIAEARSASEFAGSLLHGAWEKALRAQQSLENAAGRLERYVSFEDEDVEQRMRALEESAASGDPAAQSLLERRRREQR